MKIKRKIVETSETGEPVIELICVDKGDFPTTLVFDETGTGVDLKNGKRDRTIPLTLGYALLVFKTLKESIRQWRDWQTLANEEEFTI